MIFHVLTLFPDMIQSAASASIFGRGIKAGHITVHTVNIRDFSANKYNRVDDYPYGGGAGMVMEAEPVYRAVQSVMKEGRRPKVIYLTPQAPVLTQTKVEELAAEEELVLLCGHYEGIDERVLAEVADEYISIGDYVLTGGELAALVLMDAVSRFVPGVLHNEESSQFESLQDNLLEYPQYTRPEVWHDRAVPPVLLTGDHKKITEWRHAQSVQRTRERRPDLYEKICSTYVVFNGPENAAPFAETLSEKLSRYGMLLNYNRNKLIRAKRVFTARDFAVFVIEDEAGAMTAFRNISGTDTPAAVILSGAQKPAEAFLHFLEKKGFAVLYTENTSEEDFEGEVSRICLEIRRQMDSL